MPTFRQDLDDIPVYRPGLTPEDLEREHGLIAAVKMASNESPYEPFAPVIEAISREAHRVNRYPDNRRRELRRALADFLGVLPEELWLGGGSSELMYLTALVAGGPGTSAVYATPSFVLYRIVTQLAMGKSLEVPLDAEHRIDLEAMLAALRPETTVLYLCNPNNPTGTHLSAQRIRAFVEAVPERVLIVIDEAYYEFTGAVDYATAVPLALERDNVVVAHTFSKAYGLAGLRAGYLVGQASTLAEMRRVQPPFSVSTLAQVAAIEALRHQDLVAERMAANRAGLKVIEDGLARLGVEHADSQTNFLYVQPPMTAFDCARSLRERGVIVRDVGAGIRISVGTEPENRRLLEAFEDLLKTR